MDYGLLLQALGMAAVIGGLLIYRFFELRRMRRELVQAKRAASTANRQRNQLQANIGHEIR